MSLLFLVVPQPFTLTVDIGHFHTLWRIYRIRSLKLQVGNNPPETLQGLLYVMDNFSCRISGANEKSLTTLVNGLLLLPQCTSCSALTAKSSLRFLLQERDLSALLYENKS